MPGGQRAQPRQRIIESGPLELPVPDQRADLQPPVQDPQLVELTGLVDVQHDRRVQAAEVQLDEQALAAGQDDGPGAELGQHARRLAHGRRGAVAERR